MYVPVVAMLIFHHKSFQEQKKVEMNNLKESVNDDQSEESD
jgi:hypothetical protein